MDTNLCYKCKEKATYNHRNNIKTCDKCFITFIMNKRFRKFIHKNIDSKIKNNKVAILLSWGSNSLSLSKILANSTTTPSEGIKNKFFFSPELIFVDEKEYYKYFNVYYDENIENKVRKLGEFLKMKVNILKIEHFEKYINNKDENFFENKKNLEDLNNLVNGDAKSDYLILLRNKIINSFLKNNNFNIALLGDNSDTWARKSFSFICKGRGNQMIQETSLSYKINNINYLRPISDFNNKEISFYLNKFELNEYIKIHDKLTISNLKTKEKGLPGLGSVDLLLGNFLQNINKKFPSTISTVLRTTNKIKLKDEYKNLCKNCEGLIDNYCLGCSRLFKVNN